MGYIIVGIIFSTFIFGMLGAWSIWWFVGSIVLAALYAWVVKN